MFPVNFKPKKLYELIRIGSDNDGGYLVDPKSIENTEYLIAFGLGNDWNFEKDFLQINNCKLLGYDFKINKNFWKKNILKSIEKFLLKKISYKVFKKNIQNQFECAKLLEKKNAQFFEKVIAKNKSCMNLKNIIQDHDLQRNIFLKIDIEGSEYRVLEQILEHQSMLTGMVIEFHDTDLHVEKIDNFINQFSLELIHIHPNNTDYLCKNNNPVSIEMSFSKNPKILDSFAKLPHPLDQKSNKKNSDHILQFYSE